MVRDWHNIVIYQLYLVFIHSSWLRAPRPLGIS